MLRPAKLPTQCGRSWPLCGSIEAKTLTGWPDSASFDSSKLRSSFKNSWPSCRTNHFEKSMLSCWSKQQNVPVCVSCYLLNCVVQVQSLRKRSGISTISCTCLELCKQAPTAATSPRCIHVDVNPCRHAALTLGR